MLSGDWTILSDDLTILSGAWTRLSSSLTIAQKSAAIMQISSLPERESVCLAGNVIKLKKATEWLRVYRKPTTHL